MCSMFQTAQKIHSLCNNVVGEGGQQDKINAAWHIIRALKHVEVQLLLKILMD